MRRRILLLVVGMTALVVLAFALPLAVLIRRSVYQDASTRLESSAGQIAAYLRGARTSPTNAQIDAALQKYDVDRTASVRLPSGHVLGNPPPGDLAQLAARAPDGSSGGSGPESARDGGAGPPTLSRPWQDGRVAQLQLFGPDGPVVIWVYATDAQLRSGEIGWWWLLGGASVGLLLVGTLAGELLTRRIVRPLVQSAATASRLAAGDTFARAPTDGPTEVADVGRALNRLADRIDQLIAEERETAADVSHRLRTPLTALRLDAEALRDPAEADRVGAHVTTLERMLTAVIHAARRPSREGRMPSCDATAVVGERIEFWSALAEDQGRAGRVALPAGPLSVRAGADDLAAAVDALLENVIAHTPEGTGFAVGLRPAGGGAELTISDDGPGMPADEPVRGRSDRGSSGLGLDIARRCAAASGGSMTLGSSASGGAQITLVLGAP